MWRAGRRSGAGGAAGAARRLDGTAVARALQAEVAAGVSDLVRHGGRPPCLVAVLVGDDPASEVYVGSKVKGSEAVGFTSRVERLPGSIASTQLLAAIDALNADPAVDGILVQLPLPSGLPQHEILERLDPGKDVDGLHPLNVGRLWLGDEGFVPATPAGILQLLERSGIALAGRHAVIVGRSQLVGKPLAALLLAANCTVTVAHSQTPDLPAVCREAEILVAAIGRPAFFGAAHVGEGSVVVDVGINRLTDRAEVERIFPGDERRLGQLASRGSTLVGDIDPAAHARASAYTPVPGGVGPLTVAMLLVNTLTAARRRRGQPRP